MRSDLAGWTALLVLAGVVAGGCSDGSGGTARSTATATTAVPTHTPTATPVATATIVYALVTVGDACNGADRNGFGAVAYPYRIGTYEVTIGQYAAFLNAVARSDRHGLYHLGMAGNGSVAGIAQSGVDGAFTYAVVGPFGSAPPGAASGPDRPITYVTWFDAARFANWMANGQPAGAQDERTTERGAYALDGRVAGDAVARSAINPNTGAPPSYYLPTEDEWYKAAYYSPALERGGGGYHSLATQSDDDPGNVLGDASNQANHINDASGSSIYSVTQEATLDPGQNYLSDVGAFRASASYYGTFDQTGNVWEWTDRDGRSGPYRVIRGGGWTSTPPYLRSSLRLGYVPDRDNSNSGFRLAAPDDGAAPPGCATVDAAVAEPPAIAPPRSADPPPRLPAYGGDVVIELAPVDDAGNVDDRTGFGGVAYAYRIARYEVTIGQYAAFLNAVAASDPHGLYNPRMASDAAIAGIARQGEDGGYTYHVIDNGGDSRDRPITYVSWFDAARFANWLANGQPLGAQDETTTEDGAYALAGAVSGAAAARNAINPNTGAPPAAFLPTEDEWYKAAYYSPLRDAGAGGYFGYATQSDDPPGNRIGDEPNQANYFAGGIFSVTQGSAQEPGQNYLTDVGAFTASASYYGTFDQNGGVWEWNDLDDTPGASRGLRGGYWFSGSLALEAALFCQDTTTRESNDVGFRLAAPGR